MQDEYLNVYILVRVRVELMFFAYVHSVGQSNTVLHKPPLQCHYASVC